MISHELKCIFIHIPKNAGQSIEMHLTGRIVPHLLAVNYKANYPEKFEEYFKFTIVRNPWERILSSYLFVRKGTNIITKTLWNYFASFYPQRDFKEWIHFNKNIKETGLDTRFDLTVNKNLALQHGLQKKWITDENHQIIIDYVGRFESLQDDFAYICDKLGIKNKTLPHINKTDHKRYTEYYDEEMINEVREIYCEDISLFNYEFGQ